ncbi:MAG: hypothetical protein QY331_06330 [Melioribacteraceae bacterium]|nr:MAG: hypothetical protein QY331_06330 [Melioribacteraceae bacterium]
MKRIKLNREKLYEQVWSKPMIKLAKKYGISDVGLGKICKKMNIPKPYPGYWAKIEFGKSVEKLKLPKPDENTITEYEITVSEEEHIPIPDTLEKEIASNKLNSIRVKKSLHNPHPLVKDAQTKLADKSTNYQGIFSTEYNDIIDIRVTKNTLNRALRIMDTILKEAEDQGWTIKDPGYDKTGFIINGSEVDFLLREKQKTERVKSNSDWRGYEKNYIPTGVLSLEIKSWSEGTGVKLNFKDKNNIQLLEQINDFFASLTKLAFIRRQRQIQHENREKIKQLKIEILQRKINRITNEEKKINDFQNMVLEWNKCQNLRNFIKAVENKYADRKDARFQNMSINEWVKWANRIADWKDPLKEGIHLNIEEKGKFIRRLNLIY